MQADESKVKALESIFGGQDITASVIRTVLSSNENKFDEAVDSLLNMSNQVENSRPGQRKEEEVDEETLMDKKEREKIKTLENMFGNDLSKSVICTVLESNKGELVDTVDTLLNMTSKDINPGHQGRAEVNPRDSERLRQEEELRNYEEFKALQIRIQEEEAKAVKEAQKRAELEAKEAQIRAELDAQKRVVEEARRRTEEEEIRKVAEACRREEEARQRAVEVARAEEAKRAEARARAEAEARRRTEEEFCRRAEEEARTAKEGQEAVKRAEEARRKAVAEQERILRDYEIAQRRKEEEQLRLREEVAERVRREEREKYQAQFVAHQQAQKAHEQAQRKAEEEKRVQLEEALKRAREEKEEELERLRLEGLEREKLAHKKLVEEESRLQARLHARQLEEEREVERQRQLFEEERTKVIKEKERIEREKERLEKEQAERLKADGEVKKKLAEDIKRTEEEAKRQADAAKRLAEEVRRLELKEEERARLKLERQQREEEARRQEEQERLMREEEEQRRLEEERERIVEEERMRKEEEENRRKANYDQIAASAIFIPPKSAVPVENTIVVTATLNGNDITCTWDLPEGNAAPTNWLGLYPVRQNNNKKYVQFVYTHGAGTGQHVFHGVTPGHYEVRFYTTKSYEQVASHSETVRVGPIPTLGAQLQGDTLRVHYTLEPFSSTPTSEWLGIYEKGQRRNKKYLSTSYGNAEGQVLMKAPRTPGAYEVRLFVSGAKYNEQAVVDFVVEDNDCLHVEQTTALTGSNITVSWVLRTLEPTTGDWIGVYKADEENNSNYLSCTYTQGLSVGQTAIQAPKDVGVYELRLFSKAKGKYVTFRKSEPLTVV